MNRRTLLRNMILTIALMSAATVMSYLLCNETNNNNNADILYILAVLLIAQNTEGYVPGIIASFIGVGCVNIFFTYPYMEMNFTLDGYPLTFIGMMLVSGITSTLTTRLKQQNQILSDREKQLMEADKEGMRANLLRAISHDLRTPLTSIIGASQTYLEEGLGLTESEKSRMVNSIYEDASWLRNMVENLLSVTRIREGDMKVATTMEPLEEVVSEAIVRFRKRIPEAEVRVSLPDEVLMLPLDATLIEQVMINLLENAVHHSGTNRAIDFYVEVIGRDAWFHVRDFGKGIAAESLDKIFDGQVSRNQTASDSYKGMGIGLSVCRTIITAHGGRIFALNHGDGAEFVFTLPIGERYDYES